MNKSEEDFWNSTPREVTALMKVHIEINSVKSGKKPVVNGYIDQVL